MAEHYITDDGVGMSPEFAAAAVDPFTTTRTTRKVGMGLPLFKLAAEQTGGTFSISTRQAQEGRADHALPWPQRSTPGTWTANRSGTSPPP
jgi:signal transduction histidine kinase